MYIVAGLGVLASTIVITLLCTLSQQDGVLDIFRFAETPARSTAHRARRLLVEADSRNICIAVKSFNVQMGHWPVAIAAVVCPNGPDDQSLTTCLERIPHDPWGNEYRYDIANGTTRITCLGSDGVEGGEGEAADVEYTDSANGER